VPLLLLLLAVGRITAFAAAAVLGNTTVPLLMVFLLLPPCLLLKLLPMLLLAWVLLSAFLLLQLLLVVVLLLLLAVLLLLFVDADADKIRRRLTLSAGSKVCRSIWSAPAASSTKASSCRAATCVYVGLSLPWLPCWLPLLLLDTSPSAPSARTAPAAPHGQHMLTALLQADCMAMATIAALSRVADKTRKAAVSTSQLLGKMVHALFEPSQERMPTAGCRPKDHEPYLVGNGRVVCQR